MSRTAISRIDDQGKISHVAAAVALSQCSQITKVEALCPGLGPGYRFKERNHDKQRRIARFEAKRLLMDEIERKKISLVSNENYMHRYFPLRPWARPPKSFKKKMLKMAHDLPKSKRYVKNKQDLYFARKRAEQEKAKKSGKKAERKIE